MADLAILTKVYRSLLNGLCDVVSASTGTGVTQEISVVC